MLWGVLIVIAVYLAGGVFAAWCFNGIKGPVPVPGRLRRDIRDGLFWPVWLVLFALFWLIALRRQAFENELTGD